MNICIMLLVASIDLYVLCEYLYNAACSFDRPLCEYLYNAACSLR